MKEQVVGKWIQLKTNLLLAQTPPPAADAPKTPGEMIAKVLSDVKGWLLAAAAGYAAVQFILGAFSFMSKEPQKQSAGKDHMVHACLGLVFAFMASTIMSYLQTQSSSWTSAAIVPQITMLLETTRNV